MGESFNKSIFLLLGFLLYIVNVGFLFSLPVFLTKKQQGESLNLRTILSTTLSSIKRLILPLILLIFVSFVIIVILGFFLFFQFISEGNSYFIKNLTNQIISAQIPLVILLGGLYSFMNFAQIYFSLERKGLFSSIKKQINQRVTN